jgi:hypothetical protein
MTFVLRAAGSQWSLDLLAVTGAGVEKPGRYAGLDLGTSPMRHWRRFAEPLPVQGFDSIPPLC